MEASKNILDEPVFWKVVFDRYFSCDPDTSEGNIELSLLCAALEYYDVADDFLERLRNCIKKEEE